MQLERRQVSEARYLSFLDQTMRYFTRPHDSAPSAPLESSAAWRGSDMAADRSWRYRLSQEQIVDIEASLAKALARRKPLGDMTREDFPLPSLSASIDAWRREITDGRGFQLISGVPTGKWSADESSVFFWCFGLHLGLPGAQNRKGDFLGHVRDTGADKSDPFVRQYLTTQNIPFHCDAADVVGLLCLKKAKSGGKSRIASSVSAFNELLRRRPDLATVLFEPFMLDTRDEKDATGVKFLPVEPCRYFGGALRTFYHAEYFRTSQRHNGVELSARQAEALDLYDEITGAPRFYLDMEFEPGDIQLLSNHTIIHARTDYEDYPESERKRHLLRLWLSIEDKQ
jgi:hypothetical protein